MIIRRTAKSPVQFLTEGIMAITLKQPEDARPSLGTTILVTYTSQRQPNTPFPEFRTQVTCKREANIQMYSLSMFRRIVRREVTFCWVIRALTIRTTLSGEVHKWECPTHSGIVTLPLSTT